MLFEKQKNDLIKILGGDKSLFIDNSGGNNQTDIEPFLENERAVGGVKKGNSPLVLFPKTNEQVSEILKYCNQNKIPVFTQGGNTGLVGGSIPDQSGNGIVLSTKKMNQIISEMDENSRSVKLQAGVIIDELNAKAEEHGLFCSIKHGGTGSSNIGGNVATNSGGANALKHGVTRDNVIGLTVITADGNIHKLGGNIKDTTGINLKDMFIGSEGSLGVITEVEIKLHQKPKTIESVLLAFDEMKDVDRFFTDLQREFGPSSIEAFEYMNGEAYKLAVEYNKSHTTYATPAISLEKPHYVLADISSFDKDSQAMQEKFMDFFDKRAPVSFEGVENPSGYIDVENIMIPMSNSDSQIMWMVREHCSDASKAHSGPNGVWFDDCVPYDKVEESLNLTQKALEEKFPDAVEQGMLRVISFGHRADGNIHVHIIQPKETVGKGFDINEHKEEIEDIRLKIVAEVGGNPFAEHGVGTKLHRMKYIEQTQMEMMAKVKEMFDPNNILNPGRVIPEEFIKKDRKWAVSPVITSRDDISKI